ncbi:hypothetical protein UG54_00570 [Gordonia sihwensis]|nr:hypothetical protein UG54_00570 [Gordonia sihwensis]
MLEALLDRYDETRDVVRYQQSTREEVITAGRATIEHFRTTAYAEYLRDPETYLAAANEAHRDFITGESEGGGFPAQLTWTDDQVFAHEAQWYDPEDIDADGNIYSTSNPDGKWDWWMIGGRWAGAWTLVPGAEPPAWTPSTLGSAPTTTPQQPRPTAHDCAT